MKGEREGGKQGQKEDLNEEKESREEASLKGTENFTPTDRCHALDKHFYSIAALSRSGMRIAEPVVLCCDRCDIKSKCGET